MEEFISSLFNFETVFFRTIPAFLFSPGKLTIEFNEGKRRKYINPIRLYLIASLFYFFVIALVVPNDIVDRIISGDISKEFIVFDSNIDQQEGITSNLDSIEKRELFKSLPKLNQVLDSTKTDSTSLLQIAQEKEKKAKQT